MFKVEFRRAIVIVENKEALKKIVEDLIEELKFSYEATIEAFQLDVNYLETYGTDSFPVFLRTYKGDIETDFVYISKVVPTNERNYESQKKEFLQDVHTSI